MTTIANLIKTITRARHAELVSASTVVAISETGHFAYMWTLKQVQGDGKGVSA
jgi:hypothetical protein